MLMVSYDVEFTYEYLFGYIAKVWCYVLVMTWYVKFDIGYGSC